MKNLHLFNLPVLVLLFTLLSCATDDGGDPIVEPDVPSAPASVSLQEAVFYNINLNDRSGDSFKVRVFVDGLTEANAIFQFAATAPGTYDLLNFGNYVSDFKAFNKDYEPLEVSKLSTNQWQLANPAGTAIIEYEIRETWDEVNPADMIYRMGGTSIEEDHSLVNTFAVLGYPTGLKEKQYVVSIDHPSTWSVGTALSKNDNGYYVATDYDHLADSPLLLGNLTFASIGIDQTDIDIWTYSATGVNSSSDIEVQIEEVMDDAKAFLGELPVDRYSFLYHFEGEETLGALEHSYSSVHVIEESPAAQESAWIKYAAAHEFFHIITPLNIHSEIIEDFNFVTPTPSRHLWLYEGVTNWAAWFMRYRNNSISLNHLLEVFKVYINVNENNFDKSYSLVDISLQSYTPQGGEQYSNIYYRGAIVAALLDIRLLELSNGETGLREIILDLVDRYGPENEFQDDQFFDIFVAMTYPEIGDFIENYIKGTTELPIGDYFSKIGIQYDPATYTLTPVSTPTAEQQFLFEKWSTNL
ncbi:M61 family metallopeptidase [Salinimicrobium soli]|uniref:M61 family metallopeptidase n=1 Tax=Salinimicrobium soli TaxID=1254399 RepID=UPI003AAE0B4E